MAEALNGLPKTTATADAALAAAIAEADAASPAALRGWAAYRQAVNHDLPALLDQCENLSASTARLLGSGVG